MIKAKGLHDGRPTYFIGLSYANLKRFREQPLDTFIRIPREESGLDHDLVLFSGPTERQMVDWMASGMDADTEVKVSPKAREGMS